MNRKGVELLSDIFLIIVMVLILYVVVLGLPVTIANIDETLDHWGDYDGINFHLTSTSVNLPFKQEITLLSLMELTHPRVELPLKTLIYFDCDRSAISKSERAFL